MILKIRDLDDRWIYYDKIDRVFIRRGYMINRRGEITFGEQGKRNLDIDVVYGDLIPEGEDKMYITLCHFRTSRNFNELEMHIAFTDAYLLNDEGKTIERL